MSERKIISAIRKRGRAATVGDVAAATTLPITITESTLQRMLDVFRGQLQVTESGELLYYFPDGFVDRTNGFRARVRRGLRKIVRAIAKGAAFLFKIWVVVMLVGYFVLFVALLVAAVVASIAASAAGRSGDSRSRGRGGGFGMFYLTTRLVQTAFYLLIYSGRSKRRTKRARPLHKSVFAYVFGDEDPNEKWNEEAKRTIIAHIRASRGVITPLEVSYLTGLDYSEAQHMINSMLREFDGQPGVTEEGSLYYEFPRLMQSTSKTDSFGRPGTPKKHIIPFSGNERKINRWIGFFNSFNLVLGGYFLYFSLAETLLASRFAYLYVIVRVLIEKVIRDSSNLVFIGLGIVPVAFSALFFFVTLLRRARDRRKNMAIRRHNRTRKLMRHIIDRPTKIEPGAIRFDSEEEVADPDRHTSGVLAGLEGVGDVAVDSINGDAIYAFAEIDRIERDIASFRQSIDTSKYDVGNVVFDSGDKIDK